MPLFFFAHGANGNVAPLRVIAGPLTGLSTTTLTALTVDQATGKIFAIAEIAGGVSELLRFAPNASGNEAPIATSARDLSGALQLAFDSTGNNVIEASNGHCCNLSDFGVYTYGKQFPNGATPSAPYAIANFEPPGIADDPATKTYLVSGDDGVAKGTFRFDEDTVGSGAFNGGERHYTPAVVSVITSDTRGGQLALGYQRNIYVCAQHCFPQCAADAVYVYQHDASGNAAPLRVLMGSATKLDQPAGIYEGT